MINFKISNYSVKINIFNLGIKNLQEISHIYIYIYINKNQLKV